MGRKRSPGLRNRHGIWHIDKQILRTSIRESTGTGDLEEAELILARRIEEIRQAKIFGVRPRRTFREAATRLLKEYSHLASIRQYGYILKQLDPYIGDLPLQQVHLGTLQKFIAARQRSGVRNRTINMSLAVVRRVLNLSARLWRDENGLTWLEQAPLIQFLPEHDRRRPCPLTWDEQRRLFEALPGHLARMCLFKVNTGCREQEVCRLRWAWEHRVPELDASVFVIPQDLVKNREDRLVVVNSVARSVLEAVRGDHREFVFVRRGRPVAAINNSGWKRARREVGLPHVRVHDLKHTFGRRLRAAGVSHETRKVLLGHKNGEITTHYSAPELGELIAAVEKITPEKSGKTPSLTLLRVGATAGTTRVSR